MTTKILNVWWDGRIVGQFIQDRHGDLGFAYAQAWLDDENTRPLIRIPSQTAGAIFAPRLPAVLRWLAT